MEEYATNLKKEAELLNSFIVKQCFSISNSSEQPLNLHYTTEKRYSKRTLDILNVSNNDTEKIIQNLDLDKAHRHDQISIHIIEICSKTSCKLLEFIFNQCIYTGSFPLKCQSSSSL